MFGSRNFLFAKGGAAGYIFPAIPSGAFFSWGQNNFGMRMQGGTGDQSSPNQVGALTNWALPSVGPNHSMCTKSDGTLWGAGYNGTGALGVGNQTNYSSPVQVGSLTDWARVSAAGRFTSCVKTDGTLWTWGYNKYGQLGLGNTTILYTSPKQVGSLKTWKSPAAGETFMICLQQDGTLWSWGDNNNGQLGLGDTTRRSSPVQIGSLTTWKQPSSSSAGYVSLCTRENGTLWGWGRNNNGQLGLGDTANRSSPTQIGALTNWLNPIASKDFSLCVKTDGTLWVWGSGGQGRLGVGDTYNRSSPVQVGNLTNWVRPATFGSYSSACVKNDGTLWSWGYNGTGQLGLGNTANRSSPVQVGALTNWAYPAASGRSSFCTQATPTLLPENLVLPIILGTAKEGQILSCSAGMWRNLPTSFAYQWQRGTSNIGGATSSTYTAVAADVGSTLRCIVTATNGIGSVSATSASTATITAATDFLYAWGNNGQGRLGLNDTNNRSSPTQVGSLGTWTKVSSYRHTLAIKSDGTLWSWGNQGTGFGVGGQLGLGDVIQRSSPVQVGALTTWADVFAAPYRSFAITTSGALFAWGYNAYGGLGLGDAAIGFPRTGTARSSPVQVGSLTGWTSIQGGLNANTTAIRAGKLYSWGNNNTGQLGLGNTIARSSPVQVGALDTWSVVGGGGYNVLALTTSGTLFAWGQGYYGVNGQNNNVDISSPVQISGTWSSISNTGYAAFVMGIKSGKLYSWGRNNNGQLGKDDTINRSSPVQVGALTTWSKVNVGSGHTVGLTTSNALWTWGRNDSGQLGQNNTNNTSSPVQVGSGTNFTVVVGGGNDTLAITNS